MISSFCPVKLAWRICASSVLTFAAASPMHATPLNIGATASISAEAQINGGLIPADIAVPVGSVTALTGTVDSALDDVTATQTDGVFSQVGTVFTSPPIPFITTRFDETAVPGGDSSRGFYFVESTVTADSGPGDKVASLDRVLNGTATLNFADLDVDASASSDFEIGRRLTLTNTSTTIAYVFSISTGFDVAVTASADAVGSQSVAEAVLSISFISTGAVQLSGGAPFADSRMIDDADPGTAVVDNLVTSNALFDGVFYEASVSAIGTGAPTEASLGAVSQFLFDVEMGPGSTLGLNFFQSHGVWTSYAAPPQVSVPVPGTALVLLAGIGTLGVGRLRRPRFPEY